MLNERKLTDKELEKREEAIQALKKNKRALVKKYGKDAEKVMYGIATKQAKSKVEEMNKEKLRGMIEDALKNPKLADLNKDGKLSSYEKKRGAAIEKNLEEGEGTTLTLSQSDMDKLHKDGKLTIDGHSIIYKTTVSEEDDREDDELSPEELANKYAGSPFFGLEERINKIDAMLNESLSPSQQEAIGDLQSILYQLDELGNEARQIVRDEFPEELSGAEAYDVFEFGSSSNRYDKTLATLIDGIIRRSEEEEDELNEGAKEEGEMAASKGKKYDENPYKKGTKDHLEWSKGHNSSRAQKLSTEALKEGKLDHDVKVKAVKIIKDTLKKEGGASGLEPLVKAVKDLGITKSDLVKLLKNTVKVEKHTEGDYILTPINENN